MYSIVVLAFYYDVPLLKTMDNRPSPAVSKNVRLGSNGTNCGPTADRGHQRWSRVWSHADTDRFIPRRGRVA